MPPFFSASNSQGLEPDGHTEHVTAFSDMEKPSSGRSNPAPRRAPMPFVWQHGSQLILLDDDSAGWVMAELHFDSELCRYVEVRRAVYDLTREAIGAVISRALASGDHAAVDTALCLHDWLHTHYGIEIVADFLRSPDASYYEFTL